MPASSSAATCVRSLPTGAHWRTCQVERSALVSKSTKVWSKVCAPSPPAHIAPVAGVLGSKRRRQYTSSLLLNSADALLNLFPSLNASKKIEGAPEEALDVCAPP